MRYTPSWRNPNGKITWKMAQKIRFLKEQFPDMPYKELAHLYGISARTVSLICRGKYFTDH